MVSTLSIVAMFLTLMISMLLPVILLIFYGAKNLMRCHTFS